MISCTTQDLEKYSVDHHYGFRVGIGEIHKTKPALFSLISIMSPILYQWEEGSPVPVDDRASLMTPYLNSLYEKTLHTAVGGVPVTRWLSMVKTPIEFYHHLNQLSINELPILEFYQPDQLRLVMRARCYSWSQAQTPIIVSRTFTKEDERDVKENAYGKYYVS